MPAQTRATVDKQGYIGANAPARHRRDARINMHDRLLHAVLGLEVYDADVGLQRFFDQASQRLSGLVQLRRLVGGVADHRWSVLQDTVDGKGSRGEPHVLARLGLVAHLVHQDLEKL